TNSMIEYGSATLSCDFMVASQHEDCHDHDWPTECAALRGGRSGGVHRTVSPRRRSARFRLQRGGLADLRVATRATADRLDGAARLRPSGTSPPRAQRAAHQDITMR